MLVKAITVAAAGGVVSSVKLPIPGALTLPAISVMVVLVVHAPSTVNALLGISWLIVNGPTAIKLPPCAVGSSLARMVWVKVKVVPFGLVTTVVTTSPTWASAGKVVTIGVPPSLATSAALTLFGASGKLTTGADGAVVSMVNRVPWAVLTLPAGSVTVITGV